jgi:hypothetical protein
MKTNTARYCSVLSQHSHAYHLQFTANKRTCRCGLFTFYHIHWQSSGANYLAVRVAFVIVPFWAISYIGGVTRQAALTTADGSSHQLGKYNHREYMNTILWTRFLSQNLR